MQFPESHWALLPKEKKKKQHLEIIVQHLEIIPLFTASTFSKLDFPFGYFGNLSQPMHGTRLQSV